MIYTDSRIIKPETFQLLIALQSDSLFDDYVLVGGTSLALQLGHRHSINLDLFTQLDFDNLDLEESLLSKYPFVRTAIRSQFEVEPPELVIPISFDAVRGRLTEAVQNPDKIF